MPPDLSLCLINHRTPGLLAECLMSIELTSADMALEVFVINNTPDDEDAVRALTQALPGGRFIQNQSPLGFAANQNHMLRLAAGAYWVPLNSDTVLRPGALKALQSYMDSHPRVGIAGPRLERPDGRLQPSARDFPTPLKHFLEASGLWQLLRGRRWAGRRMKLCHPHDEPLAADWLSGACLVVRPEAAWQVGLYDEQLFPGLYAEDLEWCWRMRQANWQIRFVPEAVVVHQENQSPLDDRLVKMYGGLYAFCGRHYTRRQQAGIRAATAAALLPRWLLARNAVARRQYATVIRLPMPHNG